MSDTQENDTETDGADGATGERSSEATAAIRQLVDVSAAAIDAFYAAREVQPVRDGTRASVLIAASTNGEGDAKLRLSLDASERTPGIVARVVGTRVVPRDNWPAALMAANHWNRRQQNARCVLATTSDRAALVVEGWLPPAAELSDEQVARFVTGVISTARRLWNDPRVLPLTEPIRAAEAS
jgi:hypothetical protein